MSRIEMVAMKMLGVILKKKSVEIVGGQEKRNVCCIFKHGGDNSRDAWANSLKYEVIRMLIRGSEYSHSLCFHLCNGSSQFHVYSKKSWLSFCPEPGAIIVTAGDQIQVSLCSTLEFLHIFRYNDAYQLQSIDQVDVVWLQILSGEQYKSVIGRPIFEAEKEESISMAFLYSTANRKNKFERSRGKTISLSQQAILALILPLLYHVMILVCKKLN